MREIVDLDNIVLAVAKIETDDRHGIGYVMETIPDLHLVHRTLLVGPDGCEHQVSLIEGRGISTDDKGRRIVEYVFWFRAEQDPGFSIGEKVTVPSAEWRKVIPEATLVGMDYRASIVCHSGPNFEPEVHHECRFTMDRNGGAMVSVVRSAFRDPGVVVDTNVGKGNANLFFRRFQRCISGHDCYSKTIYDDTARSMELYFDDGSKVCLKGTYAYGELRDGNYDDTLSAVRDFTRNFLRIPTEEEVFL